jgi:hypothetical protein
MAKAHDAMLFVAGLPTVFRVVHSLLNTLQVHRAALGLYTVLAFMLQLVVIIPLGSAYSA